MLAIFSNENRDLKIAKLKDEKKHFKNMSIDQKAKNLKMKDQIKEYKDQLTEFAAFQKGLIWKLLQKYRNFKKLFRRS